MSRILERPGRVICQLARMGDLAQTLPLISALSAESSLKLICDSETEEWAALLPGVDEVISIDTKQLRQVCTGGYLPLSKVISDFDDRFGSVRDSQFTELINLNDHPVCDSLAAWLCDDDQRRWITPKLLLLRSYIRTIAASRLLNRVHLSDLWASMAQNRSENISLEIPISEKGMQFARGALHPLRQAGAGPIWAFIIGSGDKYRRLDPELMANYWNVASERENIGLILVGGKSEKSLAKQFQGCCRLNTANIVNLTGKCSASELVAVLKESDIVVGVDTGPLHWASAVGTSVLGLYFGEAGFRDTGPYGDGHYILAPECDEYPCPTTRTESCKLQCKSAYHNTQSMAELMVRISRKSSLNQINIPDGLRLFQTISTPDGHTFQPFDEIPEDPAATAIKGLVDQVIFNKRNNLSKPFSAHNQQRRFAELWCDVIASLPMVQSIPGLTAMQTKQAAMNLFPEWKTQSLKMITNDNLEKSSCAYYC